MDAMEVDLSGSDLDNVSSVDRPLDTFTDCSASICVADFRPSNIPGRLITSLANILQLQLQKHFR